MAGSQLSTSAGVSLSWTTRTPLFPELACTHLRQIRTLRSGLAECLNKTEQKSGRMVKNRARERRRGGKKGEKHAESKTQREGVT